MKKKKMPDFGMACGASVWDRLGFRLKDDHLETGSGTALRLTYCLRLEPRNMDILSAEERDGEYRRLQAVLDTDGVVPSFLSLDKTEGLDDVRSFYEELTERYPEHERINGSIRQYLSGLEAEDSIVERAHYLIVRCKNGSEWRQFDATASVYLSYHVAQRAELLVLLKNFFLRDYTPATLAEFDEEIRLKFAQAAAEPEKRRKQPLPDEEGFAVRETLRLLLPARLRFDSRRVEQGDLYRQILRVRGWPAELVHAGALHELGAMAGVTLRIYLEPISMADTTAMLTRQIDQRSSTMQGARRASDRLRGSVEKDQVETAYRGQLRRQSKMYYVTVLAEVYGHSPEALRTKAETVRTMLAAQGIMADDMFYEQREGFCSMLPYGVNLADTFKRNMPTRTIAALYPMSASRKVDPHGLILGKTSAGSPFIWDPDRRSDDITNGVVLIAGNSGQGKSYLQKKILSQLIARHYAVYALDAENEYITLFDRCGGSVQDCSGGGVRIDPFEVRRSADIRIDRQNGIVSEDDPEAFGKASAFLQHLSWLSEFHKILLPQLSPAQHSALAVLICRHYAALGIGVDHDPTGRSPSIYPTYSSLYAYIEEVFDRFDEQHEDTKLFAKDDLRQILLALSALCSGAQSAIFNGHTNVPNTAVIDLSVSSLLNGDRRTCTAALFNVLTWIWNQAVTYRKPLVFAVDELYLYLTPVVVEYLRNFAKRARKYNAVMLMTTQNLSDLNDPELAHMCKPLFELALHKFLFYPGDVDRKAMRDLLQLSESEMELIAYSRQKHCLCKCGTEKYDLTVGTLPYEAYLFGSAGGR